MKPFDDGAWPWVLDEIDRIVSDVDATARGRLLFVLGEPGFGLSSLHGDLRGRLAHLSPRPAMIAGGFDVAGARGDFAAAGAAAGTDEPTDVRFQDPDALLAALRDRMDGGMLVLFLGDIDHALPAVRWRDLFLLHSLPPVLRSSRLLVVATASVAGPLGAKAGTDAVTEELVEAGIATTLAVGRYGAREVIAALGDADADLAEDLVALCGGDGDRIAELFRRWSDAGVVARRDGRWTYAIGREEARQTAGDEVRGQLRRAFEHLGGAAAAKAYDVAVRTLRVAALEGPVFTVAALARALDVDEDALSDWLDDYLVADDDRPDAPLEGLGFFEGAGAPLYRYGFRSRTLWSVLHPVYGAATWDASPPSRRLARRYADALAATYGPDSTEAVFRVWELARLADIDQGAYHAQLVNATASARDYARVLAAEAAAADAAREPRRLVAAARRVVNYLGPVAFALPEDDLLRYARLPRSLLERAGDAPPEAWIDAYSVLGLAARGQGWGGDTARCEALSIQLLGPDDAHALVERLTTLATVLLEVVHQDYDRPGTDWLEATRTHLGLEVAWIDELFADPDTAHETVIASAGDLHRQAEAAMDRIHSTRRHHLRAHLEHAIARLEHAQGDPSAAGRSEQRALTLLDQEAESSCNLRVLALLGLADHRAATGDLEGSADAARQGTRHAVARADANDGARALGTLGSVTLALAGPEEAARYLAYSLVLGHGRGVSVATADRWVTLGRCMVALARTSDALDCFALGVRTAGGGHGELQQIATAAGVEVTASQMTEALERADERDEGSSALSFLEDVTGIGEQQTNAFLGSLR